MCKAQRLHLIGKLIKQFDLGPSSRCDHASSVICLFTLNYRELAYCFLMLHDMYEDGFGLGNLRTRGVEWSSHSAIPEYSRFTFISDFHIMFPIIALDDFFKRNAIELHSITLLGKLFTYNDKKFIESA